MPRLSAWARRINGWKALAWLSLAGVALPFVFLLGSLFAPESEHWRQTREYMLPTYIRETAITAGGGVAAAVALGVTLAWCVGLHGFPGRRVFELLLPLPLAIPPYIAAYTYDGLTGYTGAIQTTLRNRFGVDVNAFGVTVPPMAWAVFVFAATLYPYVYLLARAYLGGLGASLMENARLLGSGPVRVFFRIVQPLLWPPVLAGGTLVFLEILNDYGVTSYLGIHTFSTAIFSAWFGMGETETAVKLAVMLLAVVVTVLLIVKAFQRRGRYRTAASREKAGQPQTLTGWRAAAAFLLCLAAATVCFGVPVAQMAVWAVQAWSAEALSSLWTCAGQTLYVAGVATAAIMALATAAAVVNHAWPGRAAQLSGQATSMGYAVPSAVLSIGVVMLFAAVDGGLSRPGSGGFMLGMTTAPLLYAYAVRFFTIGYQAVDNGYIKIGRSFSEASRTLGRGVTATFFRVDLPMLRHAVAGGTVLVFVDILKELPLTLTLRPFNFDTLGTRVYEYANNEAIPETALPSLVIVMLSAGAVLATQWWNRRRAS